MELLHELGFIDLSARLFGIKYYDEDFLELVIRLGLNTLIAYSIILKVFRSTRKDSDYIFTYLIFSPLVFFVCHLFATTELSIGFAFGLFAVFSILRYRTTAIPVKEMTYMFVIIGLSVINAISTKKVSHVELLFTNLFILGIMYFLENKLFNTGIRTQIILYENIEEVRADNEASLITELNKRTGLDIIRYEVVEADYLKDAAKLRVYYKIEDINDQE